MSLDALLQLCDAVGGPEAIELRAEYERVQRRVGKLNPVQKKAALERQRRDLHAFLDAQRSTDVAATDVNEYLPGVSCLRQTQSSRYTSPIFAEPIFSARPSQNPAAMIVVPVAIFRLATSL